MKPKSKLTIRVTMRDIKLGVPRNEEKCPVAIAASRAFKAPMNAVPYSIWGKHSWNRRVKPPFAVTKKILRYDQGKGMKPFQFTVTV